MSSSVADRAEDTDLGQLPVLRRYEEQRSYPRIDLRVPAVVVTGDQQAHEVTTCNFSAEGVQIRTDRDTARAIHPRGTPIARGAGPAISLHLELPIEGERTPVVMQARIVYIAAGPSREIAMGVNFTAMKPEDKTTVAAFITDAIRPAPD